MSLHYCLKWILAPSISGIFMAFFTREERRSLELLHQVSRCNPFTPDRIQLEQEFLGSLYTNEGSVWHIGQARGKEQRPNVQAMIDITGSMAGESKSRIDNGKRPNDIEIEYYENLILFWLFHVLEGDIEDAIKEQDLDKSRQILRHCWQQYDHTIREHFDRVELRTRLPQNAGHTFALFYQIRRAFLYIFTHIAGMSSVSAKLRADIWQSVFTHNLDRYHTHLFDKMRDLPTLIMGPSGTGKELVARAIACSAYIPFNREKQLFEEHHKDLFLPLNLSALGHNIIESKLFGHVKGAFTGAVQDRKGWLQTCSKFGSVFLDEIGELDSSIQVKLLRILQSRSFQRVGENRDLRFEGKFIAATNRILDKEIEEGRFRLDFYYRLCADIIHMPQLCQILRDEPKDIEGIVLFMAKRIVGEELAPAFSSEAIEWIGDTIPPEYDWPGNFRELEQCLRNFLVRREYRPSYISSQVNPHLSGIFKNFSLSADDLLSFYVTLAWKALGGYEQVARKIGMDRRTVKAKVNEKWLNLE